MVLAGEKARRMKGVSGWSVCVQETPSIPPPPWPNYLFFCKEIVNIVIVIIILHTGFTRPPYWLIRAVSLHFRATG
jgi:hypothetical protein